MYVVTQISLKFKVGFIHKKSYGFSNIDTVYINTVNIKCKFILNLHAKNKHIYFILAISSLKSLEILNLKWSSHRVPFI